MKTILKYAKALAIKEKSDQLTTDHLKRALEGLILKDGEVESQILASIGMSADDFKHHQFFTGDEVALAESHPPIKFDESVQKIFNDFSHKIIPIELYVTGQSLVRKLLDFKKSLKADVLEQDDAIEVVCDNLVKALYEPTQDCPRGVYFFLGPPATGKSYLAELIAKRLGAEWQCKCIDMSAYQENNEAFGLIGLRKGYSGAGPGELTTFVRENPKSIIVFDEIDKAHPNNQNVLLSILSKGELKDNFGFYENNDYTKKEIATPIVDFRNTIIIFTSNLGGEMYNNDAFGDIMAHNPSQAENIVFEALSREKSEHFGKTMPAISPEILSRLAQGRVALFNRLSFGALKKIAANTFETARKGFEERLDLAVTLEDPDMMMGTIVLSLAPLVDARRVRARTAESLFDMATDYIMHENHEIRSLHFRLDSASATAYGKLLSQFGEQDPIRAVFRKNQSLRYNTRLEKLGDKLNVTVHDVRLEKLPKSVDFSGEGALAVEVPDISFAKIAGHALIKKRLEETIRFLKAPELLKAHGEGLPKGMLFYGPPGTGKTMLAKALANEADLPFIATTGSDILHIELMKKVFNRAREYAPSILFIDEIDAVGTRSGGGLDIVINQLLTEIDGFSSKNQVFIIAATNFREKLDPALLRSGRIDLHLHIPILDREARAYFVEMMLKKPHDQGINKERLLDYTAGMTGADLAKVSRESTLEAIRRGEDKLTEEIIIETTNIVKYGQRMESGNLRKQLESTAYHEAGHAVISMTLMPETKIEQVTVSPRENTLGFVSYKDDEEHRNMTRQDFLDRIAVSLAGRMAQMKKFGESGCDTGASSDLANATRLCYSAIAYYGMDEEAGQLSVKPIEQKIEGHLADMIGKRVHLWLKDAEERTRQLVEENWEQIDSLACRLMKEELIDGSQILQ